MNEPDRVREAFSGGKFSPPCSEEGLKRAQAALGRPLPQELVELYRSFNGFLGTTMASFLWPVFRPDEIMPGLVEMNLFFRNDPDVFPEAVVAKCLFFGSDGIGGNWGYHDDYAGKIIRWAPVDGDEVEVVGSTPLEVWLAEQASYDELE